MKKFETYLDNKKRKIDFFLKNEISLLCKKKKSFRIFSNYFKHALFLGSKRLRPLLSLMIYDILNEKKKEKSIFYSACSIELVHSYSLIHDDLPSLDNALFRRNHLSFHKKFGEAEAILFGDALLTLSFNWLTKVKMKNQLYIIRQFSEIIGLEGMILGQFFDLESSNIFSIKDLKKKRKILNFISINKTAKLIQLACFIPTLILNCNSDTIKKFRRLGFLIGIAYQILDDIQDKNLDKGLNYFNIYKKKKCQNILKKLFNEIKLILQFYKNSRFLLVFIKKIFSFNLK